VDADDGLATIGSVSLIDVLLRMEAITRGRTPVNAVSRDVDDHRLGQVEKGSLFFQ
jgi:hypothetical protein